MSSPSKSLQKVRRYCKSMPTMNIGVLFYLKKMMARGKYVDMPVESSKMSRNTITPFSRKFL